MRSKIGWNESLDLFFRRESSNLFLSGGKTIAISWASGLFRIQEGKVNVNLKQKSTSNTFRVQFSEPTVSLIWSFMALKFSWSALLWGKEALNYVSFIYFTTDPLRTHHIHTTTLQKFYDHVHPEKITGKYVVLYRLWYLHSFYWLTNVWYYWIFDLIRALILWTT